MYTLHDHPTLYKICGVLNYIFYCKNAILFILKVKKKKTDFICTYLTLKPFI